MAKPIQEAFNGVWNAVQRLLKEHARFNGRQQQRLSPLRGLVFCGCCGGIMKESCTRKAPVKSYRYYLCQKDTRRIRSTCPLKRVPAAELESLLLSEIGVMLAKPETLAGVMQAAKELDANDGRLQSRQVLSACGDLAKVWDLMFPVEQYKFMRTVIAKVTVHPDKVAIEYDTHGLEHVIAETKEVSA